MPFGHEGDTHTWEIELPPHVGQLVANYLDNLEEQEKRREQILRRLQRTRWFLYFATAINIAAALYYLVLIVNQ